MKASATVTVVFGSNTLEARRDVFEGVQDQPVDIPIATLLRNDRAGDGRPFHFISVDAKGSAGGGISVEGNLVRYAPATAYVGSDLFYYQIGDDEGLTRFGEIEVKVAAQLPEISVTTTGPAPSEFGLRPGRFVISRRGGTPSARLAVAIAWEGTAVIGKDYVALPRVVVFEPGQTNLVLVLQPIDDTVREVPSKTVSLSLPGASDYRVVEPRRAVMFIGDDDPLEVTVGASTRLNLSTGLFEQTITLKNHSSGPISDIRLHLHDLESDVVVYNRAGKGPDQTPFIDRKAPIEPGQVVVVTVEYYLLQALASGAPAPNVVVEYLTGGSRITDLHFGEDGELVLVYVAAATKAGRIEASSDLKVWTAVQQWGQGTGTGTAFRRPASVQGPKNFEAFRLIESP